MFLGHFAVGLASKRAEPRVSLGTAFIACQFLDLVWPVLVLIGVEHVRADPGAAGFTPLAFEHYPWSHSLLMTLGWSLGWFFFFKLRKHSTRTAIIMAAVVASHWVLDFLTHHPDLPLSLGLDTKVGLGLWRSVAMTMVVELGVFATGIALYVRATRPANKRGTWVFWSLIAFFLVAYLASAFGPKPTAETPPAAIAGPALSMWLLVAWAYWADRHRVTVRA